VSRQPPPLANKASDYKRFATHLIPYPNILGFSYAGTVESIGPDVPNFKPGDRVASIRTGPRSADPRFGAYQQYALASASSTARLPQNVPLESAASTIMNLAAVTSALTLFLGLERPIIDGKTAEQRTEKVLIYGGSSSNGGLAVRYARAAGYQVVTTSSPKHREYVESLDPQVVLDHGKVAVELATDIKANGPYHQVFDTIGLPPVTDMLVEYFASLGGGVYHTLIPPLGGEKPIPDSVQRKFAPYSFSLEEPANKELKEWFYDTLVPKGLESGAIVPTRPQWVEGGLKNVQTALDLMADGAVSGHKLVMDPWA